MFRFAGLVGVIVLVGLLWPDSAKRTKKSVLEKKKHNIPKCSHTVNYTRDVKCERFSVLSLSVV